ncbi:MAG: hypothetical protein ACI4JD_04260, partial [Ruminococcus sp.]
MFRDGLEMNKKKGVKVPARSDMTVGAYWSSGHATNPNFSGIDRNDPENKKWSALQIVVSFEKEIKGVTVQAEIDITEYMKVTMQGYKDWDGLKLDFDYAANMYTQTNFDFSIKIQTSDNKWEDISDTIKSNLASDEISAKYKAMIDAKEDGYIKIVDTPLFKTKYLVVLPIPIFSVNLNLNYVLKFNMAAGLTSDFTYLDATQVGMRGKTYGKDKGLESYKHELIGANRYSYDLNVCGYLGVKTGVRGELTLSFNGLESLGEVGIAIELGVYADFYGYMNLHIAKPQQYYNNVEKSFSGGYYIEVGIYLEVELIARSQAFGAEAGLMLLDLKFPLFSFGQRYVPCDLTLNNTEFLMNKNEADVFEMCGISANCMDMKSGNIVTKKPGELQQLYSGRGKFYVIPNDDAFYLDNDKMKLCIDGENSKKKAKILTVKIYSSIPVMNNAGQGYTDYYYCGSVKVYWADPSLNINSIDEFGNKTVTATYCLKLPDDSFIELDSKEVKVTEPMGAFDFSKVYHNNYDSIYEIDGTVHTDEKSYDDIKDTYGEYLSEDTVFYRNITDKRQFYVYFIYYDSNEKCWKGDVGRYNIGETPVPPEAAQSTPEMTGWSGYAVGIGNVSEITPLTEKPLRLVNSDGELLKGETGKPTGNGIREFTGESAAQAKYNTEKCFSVLYDDGNIGKDPDGKFFCQKYVAQYKDCNITFNYEGEEELLSKSVTVPFGESPELPELERFVDRVGNIVGWDTDGDFEMDVKYNIFGNVKFPAIYEDGMIINALYDQPVVSINLMNYNAETGQYEECNSFKAKSKQTFTFDGEEVLLDGEKVYLDGDETDIFSQMLDDLPPVCNFKYWEIAKIETYNWDNPE